jgi:hypothetical protein
MLPIADASEKPRPLIGHNRRGIEQFSRRSAASGMVDQVSDRRADPKLFANGLKICEVLIVA